MLEQNKLVRLDIVKPYLGFIDTHVLFKKPISCAIAIVSALIPFFFLAQAIDFGLFENGQAKYIAAVILILAVLLFAGVFGAGIWWRRRIAKDDGPKMYDNFRRFIQTLGEWAGTMTGIVVFGSVIILLLLLRDEYDAITGMFPLPVSQISFTSALAGPIAGFLIIVATKIALFLLDPVSWLIKQIGSLIARIALYFYRCTVKVHGVIEQNAPVWIGVVWILSWLVVISGLIILLRPGFSEAGTAGGVITVAMGLCFMVFLVIKRKQYEG